MYNSTLTCTYSFYDSALRTRHHSQEKFDLDDVEEFEDFSELIYQVELLKVLGFSSAEVEKIGVSLDFKLKTEKLIEVYNKTAFDEKFLECVKMAKDKHLCEDLESGFITLFSYDYFFLTHKCICDFLLNGSVSELCIDALKLALE